MILFLVKGCCCDLVEVGIILLMVIVFAAGCSCGMLAYVYDGDGCCAVGW